MSSLEFPPPSPLKQVNITPQRLHTIAGLAKPHMIVLRGKNTYVVIT